MRRTPSAAVTSALSVRNGREPWPGVPATVRCRQFAPFSPTGTPSTWPRAGGGGAAARRECPPLRALPPDGRPENVAAAGGDRHAPALGDDVVGLHHLGAAVHQVAGAAGAARLLVGGRAVGEGAARPG